MSCVLIYSKNTLFRESLQTIISKDIAVTMVVGFDNMSNLKETLSENSPRYIIVDLYSRSVEDNILKEILLLSQDIEIIIATTVENKHINYYHQVYGVKHYIYVEDKAENIQSILNGIFSGSTVREKFKCDHSVLTSRECEVLKLIAVGNTSKEIAEQLCISKNTVDTHRNKMLQKLNLANSASLVQYAYKSGGLF